MFAERYPSLSLWHDSLAGDLRPRAPLVDNQTADVAIVGAGYTGLWTAYYLKKAQPGLDVAVVEAEVAGFGASGRNGGWCVGALAGIDGWLAAPATHDGAVALMRAMHDTVDEVGHVAEAEEISCDFAKGGAITVATAPAHEAMLRSQVEEMRSLGFGEDDVVWLEPDECRSRIRTRVNLGGMFLAHCAAVHPAKLVRGLADVVERMGVRICEQSPVREISERTVSTGAGSVRADVVLRAAEGYTARLPREGRRLVPLHSMMVATEPLPGSTWEEIGVTNRETFGDGRRITIYGQRTADGRLAFGGRAEYYFGSGIRDVFPNADPGFRAVYETLLDLFPVLHGVEITHRWGGPIGVPRDSRPSVGIDRQSGYAWAGGYVGEGVAASNLAGRTMADLILERESNLVGLPWVGKPFPTWEPEPVRWAAVKAITSLARSVDATELRGRPTPKIRSRVLHSFMG